MFIVNKKRICSKCGLEKDVKEFGIHKTSKDGLNTWCKYCCNENSKRYNENHKEEIKEKRKKWRKDHKELVNERNKKWIENNKEYKIEYIKNNNESIKEYNKQYWKNNRETSNYNTQRYRNNKKKLPATLTLNQWNQCKEYFGNKCAYCGEEKPLEKEHFVALTNGGGYTMDNIIPACKSCNCSKRDKVFDDWYIKQVYYTKDRELKILEYLTNRKEVLMTLKEKLEFLLSHIDVEFECSEWSVDYDSRIMLWGDWEVVCVDSLLSDNVNISECEFRERK